MKLNDPDNGGKRVDSVRRSFRVIEALRGAGTVRIDDVAEALDIPSSTAHVHLKTLESAGYVVMDSDGYRLGLRFLRNGCESRQQDPIYSVAKSEVDELAEETGEVANLGVEENGQRVILYQSEGSEAVYDNAPIGEYTNMHWTALGKAMLAELPPEYVDEILDRYGVPSQTENTVDDREQLHEVLESIRDRGVALEDEERREGIRSIAVPTVVDGSVVGAISLSGPKERFDDGRIDDVLLPELRDRNNVVEVKYAYE